MLPQSVQPASDTSTEVSSTQPDESTAPAPATASEQPADGTGQVAAASPPQPAVPPPPTDLWERIRRGMQLVGKDRSRVATEAGWFAAHPSYMDRVAERASPYLYLIVQQVESRKMPLEIALLPVVESAFQPFAYSHGRAAGLWQFVPGTGRRFGLRQTWWYDGRRDIAESTRAALDYLQFLHDRYDGDWLLALAAYNSGEGTVDHAIEHNRRHHKPITFWALGLPDETRSYVPRLLAVAAIVSDPGHYGITLKPIPNKPVLAEVDTGSQIDLSLAAELAGLSVEDLYRYNPAFNRWATDPSGPNRLLLPVDKVASFEEKLEKYPAGKRMKWERHRIRPGESLGLIARHFRTTTRLIKRVNGLRGNTIRAGHTLIVPVARTRLAAYSLSATQRRKALQNRRRSGKKVEHVVREGDTLWDIARHYDVKVGKLAKWNGMAPRDTLQPGNKLVVWTQSTTSRAKLIPVSFTHPRIKAVHRKIGYTVRSGDSLARIAQRFRVGVSDLKRWNRVGKYLHPGQHLTLYIDVTSQSGNI